MRINTIHIKNFKGIADLQFRLNPHFTVFIGDAWEKALRKLEAFERGEINANTVAKFAGERGFFSVWFSVFHAHPDVRQAIVNFFKGTATTCFDDQFNPIHRNPANKQDPI